jgi:hypothetical protein
LVAVGIHRDSRDCVAIEVCLCVRRSCSHVEQSPSTAARGRPYGASSVAFRHAAGCTARCDCADCLLLLHRCISDFGWISLAWVVVHEDGVAALLKGLEPRIARVAIAQVVATVLQYRVATLLCLIVRCFFVLQSPALQAVRLVCHEKHHAKYGRGRRSHSGCTKRCSRFGASGEAEHEVGSAAEVAGRFKFEVEVV